MSKAIRAAAILALTLLGATLATERSAADRGLVASATESTLYTFGSRPDGNGPYAGLTPDGAGDYYGTTYRGDSGGESGTVFKLIPTQNGYQLNILYTFTKSPNGWDPQGGVLADRRGALYGTTWNGGSAGVGAVYKLMPARNGYAEKVIHSFRGGADGTNPNSSLIEDATGSLYGTATFGGAFGNGIIFKLTPNVAGYGESVLYSFQSGGDGAHPWGSLIADANGAFYGTTGSGGTAGRGTVFKLTPKRNGYAESILYSFQGAPDGSSPVAALVADTSGDLFGTTTAGGQANAGAVFKLTPNGNGYDESVIHSINGIDEYYPQAPLFVDDNGALYGTTAGESPDDHKLNFGTVFKLVPGTAGYSEITLYRFGGGIDGRKPFGGLVIDKAGTLFGTTNGDFLRNDGSVFSLTPHGSGYTETNLHSFHWFDDGANPFGGVTPGAHREFFGTTSQGGTLGLGTIWEAVPSLNGYSERVLYRFQGGADGANPYSAPISDGAGGLYGTTPYTVYKFAPSGPGFVKTVLHQFRRSDGFFPSALIADSNGALYAANEYGGAFGNGTVFKMTPANGGYSFAILHDFKNGGDGDFPDAPVALDNKGSLYGTTYQGGTDQSGTVFKMTPNAGGYHEKIIHNFNSLVDGANPIAGLFIDSSGSLFGTTSMGDRNILCGAVFKLTPSHGAYVETFVHTFTGNPDGCSPDSALVEASSGVLYGLSEFGGASGQGCIYELTPSGNSYTESVLFSFTDGIVQGEHPYGQLFQDARGALYGTAYDGGRRGMGTIFMVNP